MTQFSNRHIGINPGQVKDMLSSMGLSSVKELIDQSIPQNIRIDTANLDLPPALSESELDEDLRNIFQKNRVFKSLIGLGYHNTISPSVIIRNVLENPGWYTQYTPYQAEISQGRLEALLNFQTMISDLTALPIANASLLDEGTAAAEAMIMFYTKRNKRVRKEEDLVKKFFVDRKCFPQTIDVLKGRASALGIEIVVGDWQLFESDKNYFGALLQYPDTDGAIHDYKMFISQAKDADIRVVLAADLLSLTLLVPPGELGADVAVGNTQRFGVPLGAGGPHAAYFACIDTYKRVIPGRIIGVSQDRFGNPALRMALQTREQHIKREKATSNICTAQALLAIMAGFYGVYHGPDGIRAIAEYVHNNARRLAQSLEELGFKQENENFFDTIRISLDRNKQEQLKQLAEMLALNFNYGKDHVCIALDETCTDRDIDQILNVFKNTQASIGTNGTRKSKYVLPQALLRSSEYMQQDVFKKYHTETAMMRYIKSLENKDLSLVHSMIPLGSCTMKLNAASELMPLTWSTVANIHPFAPVDQRQGYLELTNKLSSYLCKLTGFDACSFMPNSGAQGEYAGLMCIRAYHLDNGDMDRNIVLIPSSAHGTNPASGVMAGMKVVVVACDDQGNVVVNDLRQKAETYKDQLAALMITYPSTHGVFEEAIAELTDIVHQNGGLVYMDGANMNAQIGYTSPAFIGADVCHLNLHKTFAIPHGGGGPGMGPICVNTKLKPYLPKHVFEETGGSKGIHAISSAPYGSASILIISYAFIRLLGINGLTRSTEIAILNANYLMFKLQESYPILYVGSQGRCAHEFILDLRPFKDFGVSAEDVAKRLMDYGFHAPTLSFPVPGTFMIEPTESEPKEELDLFIEAMQTIRQEIEEIKLDIYDKQDNVFVNAPHPLHEISADKWDHSYNREKAAYPLESLKQHHKFWVGIGRVDNAYGDRHLMCTCAPIESYMDVEV